MHARWPGQGRTRCRGPRLPSQVGDHATGGSYQRHPSGMVPNVTSETYCTTEYPVSDEDEIDAGGSACAAAMTLG